MIEFPPETKLAYINDQTLRHSNVAIACPCLVIGCEISHGYMKIAGGEEIADFPLKMGKKW
ncbi:MAG TPA: hypothetical protein VMJ32_09530 [Pirellulales bacterium]|nr:hypothetical protein [Pirellulales bacterium]